MIVWAEGVVVAERRRWSSGPAGGAIELTVRREPDGAVCRALAYTALVPEPRVGDRVLLNVAALDRGLGTGGYALVVATLDAGGHLTGQPPAPVGHLVKARYLPHQAMVAGADEQGSPFHALLAEADSIDGMPVVVADLHSALPAILAGIHDRRPGCRVVYLMSDQGALPLAFSRSVAELRAAGWLTATVTAGQAFGGDLEAVTVHSGLLTARLALGAEITVVSQGPGNLGTGTRWGFSGVAVGEIVNAVAVLGGRPVAALRMSSADQRPRHRGLSHHSVTALGRVAAVGADLAVPVFGTDFDTEVAAGLAELVALNPRHRAVDVAVAGLGEALAACPVGLSTMGRSLDQDEAYFLAAAAAGAHAADLLDLG